MLGADILGEISRILFFSLFMSENGSSIAIGTFASICPLEYHTR